MDIKALSKPFPASLISWRLGATNKAKTSGIALAYIDARDVIQRLDEVCGPENWQNKHPHANGKTSCSIGIKIGGEWVWKENGAGDSDVEAAKGAFSDSFKRAAVLWGIGRYLYDFTNMWVEIEPAGNSHKIKQSEYKKLEDALEKLAKGLKVAPSEPPVETPEEKANKWFAAFKPNLESAASIETVKAMVNKQQGPLQSIKKDAEKVYDEIMKAVLEKETALLQKENTISVKLARAEDLMRA